MIDVVYNHTAHDSSLVQHPEYFHQDAQGHPFTTVPDWSDVIDLKHPNPELTRYLIDSLVGGPSLGWTASAATWPPSSHWNSGCRRAGSCPGETRCDLAGGKRPRQFH